MLSVMHYDRYQPHVITYIKTNNFPAKGICN